MHHKSLRFAKRIDPTLVTIKTLASHTSVAGVFLLPNPILGRWIHFFDRRSVADLLSERPVPLTISRIIHVGWSRGRNLLVGLAN